MCPIISYISIESERPTWPEANMCTVSYIPLQDGTFYLTQNRDEAPNRSAFEIEQRDINGQQVHFPVDTGARGSWIAMSDGGKVTCVLNGAFDLHKRNPPYRRSRGLILLDQFEYDSTREFIRFVNLHNIEPFTMLFMDSIEVSSLVWDGVHKHVQSYDPQKTHLWASSTLYNDYWKERRQIWFEDWQKKNHPDAESILKFHKSAGDGDPENDIVMNRGGMVCTTSITQITKTPNNLDLHFLDLTGDIKIEHSLSLVDGH